MLLELAGSIMSGVLSGGATGLLGVALQQWGEARKRAADLDMMRVQHVQTLELRKLDIEQQATMAAMSAASAERLAEINAEARAGESASADYQASVAADRATYLSPDAQSKSRAVRWMMGIADFLRGIIRPGATIYSLVLLSVLLAWVRDMHARSLLSLSPADARDLAMEVVRTATYLAVTCTVWWFGVRPATSRR